jgi:hypothetical protein
LPAGLVFSAIWDLAWGLLEKGPMPNHSPLSRYLLLGMAALMLGAALPDAEVLFQKARQWQVRRAVVVEPFVLR